MSAIAILRDAGFVAWGINVLILLAPLWRLVRRGYRSWYLDPLWGVCLLGVGNRIGFSAGFGLILNYAMALVVAVLFGGFAVWYQKHDRRG